jgi:hypothetical protein
VEDMIIGALKCGHKFSQDYYAIAVMPPFTFHCSKTMHAYLIGNVTFVLISYLDPTIYAILANSIIIENIIY